MTRAMPTFDEGRRRGLPVSKGPAWARSVVAAVLAALLVHALCGFPAGHGTASAASADDILTPWNGFVAVGGEQYGPVANPAGLGWLDGHALQAAHLRPLADGSVDGRAYVYLEPDTGVGAGQLAYLAAKDEERDVREYIYSAAWRGGGAAIGFNVRHVTLERFLAVGNSPSGSPLPGLPLPASASTAAAQSGSSSTWAMDVGYRGQWARWLGVGVLARNVLVGFGDLPREAMPAEITAGIALEFGRGLVAAADYVVSGWDDAADASASYRYGLEGRIGRLTARIGQRVDAAGAAAKYAGLGFRLDSFGLNATVGESEDGRVLSIGLSLYY